MSSGTMLEVEVGLSVEVESRLRTLLQLVDEAVLVAGMDYRIEQFNSAAEQMFRCSAAQAIGRPLSDFIPPEAVASQFGPVGSVTPLPLRFRAKLFSRRRDGERFPIEVSATCGEATGRPFFIVLVRDVGERERTTAMLRMQSAIIDRASEAVMIRDDAGQITFWNHGAERIYGWSAAEALEGTIGGTFTPQAFLDLAEAQQILALTGEWCGEFHHVRHDGEIVVLSSRWFDLPEPNRRVRHTLIIDADITERKQLEAQYLHAQKMESIGTLAGGVAHDFNNLLTVVLAAGELLRARPDLDAESRNLIDAILRAGEGGASLIRQLLTVSRRQMVELRVIDLNRVIRETERMLQRVIGADVAVVAHLDPDLGRIQADAGQIEQVILNLVVNARDAMPNGGTLTIETRNVDLPNGDLGAPLGRFIRMTVSDTGHGMDEAVRARVFEPFFTTKELGRGTGLGLATVHGIVLRAGGHIGVASEIGRGARFTIHFPRVEGPLALESGISTYLVPRGTETILIAEDERDVRGLARATLEANGYSVLEAASGREALTLAESFAAEIHLLVADLVMPQMGGQELAMLLQAARPGIRTIFLSGHGDHSDFHFKESFLPKPFIPAVLARKVRGVLDRQA